MKYSFKNAFLIYKSKLKFKDSKLNSFIYRKF